MLSLVVATGWSAQRLALAASRGLAWLGLAWLGLAWLGLAWLGSAAVATVAAAVTSYVLSGRSNVCL